jgi:hypothetical protein
MEEGDYSGYFYDQFVSKLNCHDLDPNPLILNMPLWLLTKGLILSNTVCDALDKVITNLSKLVIAVY